MASSESKNSRKECEEKECEMKKCKGRRMNFDEYQGSIEKYDLMKPEEGKVSMGMVEKVLGLAGESGETADKVKKIIRDKGGVISEEDRGEIVKELGDVLWYTATIARYLGVPFSEVAEKNLEKLEKRRERGKLHGEGDNR